jgi:hypothetical protein
VKITIGTCSCYGLVPSFSYKRLFARLDGACSTGAVSISANPKFPVMAINIMTAQRRGGQPIISVAQRNISHSLKKFRNAPSVLPSA